MIEIYRAKGNKEEIALLNCQVLLKNITKVKTNHIFTIQNAMTK